MRWIPRTLWHSLFPVVMVHEPSFLHFMFLYCTGTCDMRDKDLYDISMHICRRSHA